MSELRVDTEISEGAVVARISGDIDLVNHADTHEELLRTALDGGPLFVADLTHVGYIDSNGIRMLFGLARELSGSRIAWAAVLPADSPLQRLLKVTAFDEVVQILPSVEDAVAALKSGR